MAELHLNGYICSNYDGIISLTDDKEDCYSWKRNSIIDSIENFASEYGMVGRLKKGLGGKRAIIDECNLRVYFTDEECELEDAMLAMDVMMYGGDIQTKVTYVGYSEYTITGLNLDEFSIGRHDLDSEFRSHYGEYCHILIEC